MTKTLGFVSVSDMFAPYGKVWCRDHYWHYRMEQSDSTAVGCTFAIVILSILLEIVVHFSLVLKPRTKTPDNEEAGTETESSVELLPTSSSATPQNTGSSHVSKDVRLSMNWCTENAPDPPLRASRFAMGLIIYAGILAAFIVRIRDARDQPYIPEPCQEEIGLEGPDWTAIAFLNIIPFICATFALLRAFVDCVLVRWGKSLGIFSTGTFAVPWPPCAPVLGILFVVVFVVVVALYLLFECVRIPAALIMGRWEASIWTAEFARGSENGNVDEERRGEEGMGLVQNADGGENADGEGSEEPPAYDEAVESKVRGGNEDKEDV